MDENGQESVDVYSGLYTSLKSFHVYIENTLARCHSFDFTSKSPKGQMSGVNKRVDVFHVFHYTHMVL